MRQNEQNALVRALERVRRWTQRLISADMPSVTTRRAESRSRWHSGEAPSRAACARSMLAGRRLAVQWYQGESRAEGARQAGEGGEAPSAKRSPAPRDAHVSYALAIARDPLESASRRMRLRPIGQVVADSMQWVGARVAAPLRRRNRRRTRQGGGLAGQVAMFSWKPGAPALRDTGVPCAQYA